MSDTGGESRVGTQIGPYRLRRLLGKGGMGEVYEAEDTVKDRIVALKLLPESASNDPVFRKRLQREAHSAGRLQEPHVVPIHDYGEVNGLLYVDMRMIDGTDLRKMLKRFGPMTPARAVAIVRQIASALDAAHESGVMHRDVKPENIILTRDDFAYLVDFGIANAATDEKLTELGTAVGTYAYMAPERFTNDEVTYRADIYALACVLHECLTGSQPYPGDSVSVVITAHLMQPIPKPSEQRPGIPAAFDQVISRGMAKKPAGPLCQRRGPGDGGERRADRPRPGPGRHHPAAQHGGHAAGHVDPRRTARTADAPDTATHATANAAADALVDPGPDPTAGRPAARVPHADPSDEWSAERADAKWSAKRTDVDGTACAPTSPRAAAHAQGHPVDPDRGRGSGIRARAGRVGDLVPGQTGRHVVNRHADDHNDNRAHRNHPSDSADNDAYRGP